jgi:hypothetical protein
MNKRVPPTTISMMVVISTAFALVHFGRWLALGFFSGGLLLGMLALWLDEHVLYKYYNSESSTTISNPYLISRSLLFLIILVPLSIFVISSTGNTVGQGFVLSLVMQLWVEMMLLRDNLNGFNDRFAQQAKKPLSQKEQRGLILVFSVVSAGLIGVILL